MLGCCGECKDCKMILCIIVALQGFALLIISAVIANTDSMYNSKLIVGVSLGGGGVTIAVLVLITSGVGFYGALNNNKWFLYGFVAALLIFGITILSLGAVSVPTLLADDIATAKKIDNHFVILFMSTKEEDKKKVEKIEKYYKCKKEFLSDDMASSKNKTKNKVEVFARERDEDYDPNKKKTKKEREEEEKNRIKVECTGSVTTLLFIRTALFVLASVLYGIFWIATALGILCCVVFMDRSERDENESYKSS